MKYMAACSFGKDSIATVILAKEHNEPLDEVVYCEVMFDDEISGEVPEHRQFIYETAKPIFESWGIKVTILRSQKTYVSNFKHVITKGDQAGKIQAFPLCGRCSIQRDCKLPPINKYKRQMGDDVIQYLGIAKDEQERLLRLEGTKKISLLDKYGIEESATFDMCRAYGLLSPIYEFTDRGGCWFCPNAKEKELRHLYDYHKDLWERMLELQALPNKVTEKFDRKRTFAEIDEKFKQDDAQMTLYDLFDFP